MSVRSSTLRAKSQRSDRKAHKSKPPVATTLRRQPRSVGSVAMDNRLDAVGERLVKAAGELFLRHGYRGVSVRALAKACDLTTGAIYSRFSNKTELLVAAVEARMRADLEGAATARAMQEIRSDGDPDRWRPPGPEHQYTKQELTAAVPTLSDMAENYPLRAALRALLLEGAAAARRNAGVQTSLRREQLQHLEWWIRFYRSWQEGLGVDSAVDMDAFLRFLWAAELGLGVLEAYGIEPPKPRAWRGVIERVMKAMQP